MENGILLYFFSTAIVAMSVGFMTSQPQGWLTLGALWAVMGAAIAFMKYLDGD